MTASSACSPYPNGVEQPPNLPLVLSFSEPSATLAVGLVNRLLDVPQDATLIVQVEGEDIIRPVVRRVTPRVPGSTDAQVTFEHLPPGDLRVVVTAIDGSCRPFARAYGEAVVVAGRSQTVSLALTPVAADTAMPIECPPVPPSPAPSALPSHPPTGTVLAVVPVGTRPAALAAADQVWVTDADDGTVRRISLAGEALGATVVGGEPRGVGVDRDGAAWVALADASAVVKLGPEGQLLGRVGVDRSPWDVAVDAWGRAWVTHLDKKTVTVLAPEGAVVESYRVEKEPAAVAIGADATAWVVSARRDLVLRLSAEGAFQGESVVGRGPADVAAGPDGHAWVVTRGDGRLVELDETGTEVASHALGGTPVAVAVDDTGRCWVAGEGDGSVRLVAGGTVRSFTVGGAPSGLAFDAAGDVWVLDGTGVVKRLAR